MRRSPVAQGVGLITRDPRFESGRRYHHKNKGKQMIPLIQFYPPNCWEDDFGDNKRISEEKDRLAKKPNPVLIEALNDFLIKLNAS